MYLKLRFPPGADLNGDFQKVVIASGWQSFVSSKDFYDNVLAPQGRGIFTGRLAGLPEPVKLSLFQMVCGGLGTLGTAAFKGQTYLSVTLGNDGTVYNTIQLNQSSRVAKVINERLLDDIKDFRGVASVVGIDGVEFRVQIFFRNFVSEDVPAFDTLDVYVPVGLANKFADQDITSQQLMDGSVVLVNDNRVQVSLSF